MQQNKSKESDAVNQIGFEGERKLNFSDISTDKLSEEIQKIAKKAVS